jgi:glycosyltransferase involved in cell wall biosynthesis
MNILHITPHLGTGVGTVTLHYLKNESIRDIHTHRVIALDDLNNDAKETLNELNISFKDSACKSPSLVTKAIEEADIVLIHWWNHPLLSVFLMTEKLPQCRLIMWCHISGIEAPNNFTLSTLRYPDKFIFTTPMSYHSKYINQLSDLEKEKLGVAWSTGGVERLQFLKPTPHDGVIVGYIGNLDFTKLNPDFINLCEMVTNDSIKFVVVGGPFNSELLIQAKNSSIADRIEFTGYVSEEEKWKYLSTFDIFGYPLAPHHFGSCDQTIQEAMAVSIPPVVLNNPMESYMVKDNITGLVCNNGEEYAESIDRLAQDKNLREKIGGQAKEFAQSEYSISNSSQNWDDIFTKLIIQPKTEKIWPKFSRDERPSVGEIFAESLGEDGFIFKKLLPMSTLSNQEIFTAEQELKRLSEKPNWTSPTKSTPFHYLKFFPNDADLQKFCHIIKKRI